MAGYGVMAMVMTATPLAMTEESSHQFSDAAFVIQWHVVGMFAPAFFHRFSNPSLWISSHYIYRDFAECFVHYN
jgi:hypothetical protein